MKNIGFYRGLKEKYDPEKHIGFFITTDTNELLFENASLGNIIHGCEINDGSLLLFLESGDEVEIVFPEATETEKGLLSAEDKIKLNNYDSTIEELSDLIASAKESSNVAQSDINTHKLNKSNPHEVTKIQVGLGNVTNDALIKRSEMGVANGVATLDSSGKVPSSLLPSYVDDIVDVYATYTVSDTGVLSDITLYSDSDKTETITGESGKIYLNIADGEPNYQFRWTGTIFAQTGVSPLILGEISGTAYDGAKGKDSTDKVEAIRNTSLSWIDSIDYYPDMAKLTYVDYTGDLYGQVGESAYVDIETATYDTAGLMSATDKLKLDSIDNKANIDDLSNVLSEEVVDSTTFPDINTLTRELLKKDLFIDMWNEACYDGRKRFGCYNEDTGFFEYGPVKDLTYEDAILALSYCLRSPQECVSHCQSVKGLRVLMSKVYWQHASTSSWKSMCWGATELEYIRLTTNNSQGAWPDSWDSAFADCYKLHTIEPHIQVYSSNASNKPFRTCYALENVKIYGLKYDFWFSDSPKLSLASLQFLVTNAANKSAITVTVHADVYAKLTGDTTNEAAAALTEEELAQWQQLVTDAAAKNISFATV